MTKDDQEVDEADPDPTWAVMGDSGFQGLQHNVRAILPKKRPPNGHLTASELTRNRTIASSRVIVENFYARLKNKFAIVSHVFKLDTSQFEKIFICCASLTNFNLLSFPLRA